MNYKVLFVCLIFGALGLIGGCEQKETCVADCEVGSGAANGDELTCQDPQGDIDAYLAANKSCETDEECTTISSICFVDDCESVAVNVDADPTEWEALDRALSDCSPVDEDGIPVECNYVGECGYDSVCSSEGQCVAQR